MAMAVYCTAVAACVARTVPKQNQTATEQQYRQCRTRRSMLEDIKLEISDAACDLLDDIDDGKIEDRLICDHAAAACETLRTDEFLRAKIRPSHKRARPPPPSSPPRQEAGSGA